MERNSAASYRPFANIAPGEIRHRFLHHGIDEDTLALVLALTGLAIMTMAAASMLVAFAIL